MGLTRDLKNMCKHTLRKKKKMVTQRICIYTSCKEKRNTTANTTNRNNKRQQAKCNKFQTFSNSLLKHWM